MPFPMPQADRLDKVALVVDAVGAGAVSTSAIAQTLEMVERQGAYYAAGAGYLGLVERSADRSRFELTDRGRQMLDADAPTRAALLADAVGALPEVGVLLAESPTGLVEHLSGLGLDKATAVRRASTISSWTRSATDPKLAGQISPAHVRQVWKATR